MDLYRQTCKPGWYWFEDIVTYNNATLPQALLLSSQWMERADMAEVALGSLYWLAEIQTCSTGYFVPVGSNGFSRDGESPLRSTADRASRWYLLVWKLYRMTGDKFWNSQAQNAFMWFLGQNDIALPLRSDHRRLSRWTAPRPAQ
jgi:hypothetical protein